jgi:hypothetical protein
VNKVSKDEKHKTNQNSADLITKRSIELFGLTPEEISDKNEIWMRKKGYIINQVGRPNPNFRTPPSSNLSSRLRRILKIFHSKNKD